MEDLGTSIDNAITLVLFIISIIAMLAIIRGKN